MYSDFKLADDRPAYIQVKDYMKRLMVTGAIQRDQKLPSTRELSALLHVSRNTVLSAYSDLEDEGYIYAVKGRGHYAVPSTKESLSKSRGRRLDWETRLNDYAKLAEAHDLMKHGIRAPKDAIMFTSIAPDETLFDVPNVKRAFLDRMAVEGEVLLNYGYAKGYKPLIDYLRAYMENKGVDMKGKDLLITSGFTEGLSLLMSALNRQFGRILCENPTHHTAIKNFKMHGYDVIGVDMEPDGLSLEKLELALSQGDFDAAFLVPSYHNPTGIVMSQEKRLEALKLLGESQIPVIEDGFNEELRYSGSHIAPLAACVDGDNNSLIYLGSFSKILFPGIRVGWVLADRMLIDVLESVKRARSIHTSTLDQSLLYQYLYNGNFEKYLKRAKAVYKRKYELATSCCKEWIPMRRLSGDGGLHLFVEFDPDFRTRDLLEVCSAQGVVFTPGDIFYTDGSGRHTLRLGFSRVSEEHITQGIRVIGEAARGML